MLLSALCFSLSLIGIVKINSLGRAHDEISGSLYTKASTSLSLRYYTSEMSRLARNAILLRDIIQREKPLAITVTKDKRWTV